MGQDSIGKQGVPTLDYAAGSPSRVRYWVVVFAVALAFVTYIDRVCISQAAPSIRADLGLSETQMGFAFAAFYWAYALFEVPAGWMGDRWGARRVLMRIVIWWSFFTAATGWVWNLGSLVVTRALFGAGEAGCFPNITKTFTAWLPVGERVRAQGIMWLGARWGGAFTPLLVVLVLEYMHWRLAFAVFGALGVVWAIAFYSWYRDDPRQNPKVNASESALIPPASEAMLGHEPVPWKRLITSKTVWLLWAQYICLNYGWAFYITWLPTYLLEARQVTLHKGAMLAGIPLFFGGLGSVFCGYFATYLGRRMGNVVKARRRLACTGFLGAACCLALSVHIKDPLLAMIVVGLASFANDLAMPPSWGACMDVGGKICGTLSGSMNMMGNFGASLAPIITGFLLVWTNHNWTVIFYVSAAVYALGTVCWLTLDSVTPLMQPKRGFEVLPVTDEHK